MIYVTGDTHIPVDIAKLSTKQFPEQKELSKEDFIIICGDFGGVWNNQSEDLYWRKWLDEKNFTTLFVDGNHENFDLLNRFETVDFHGGTAHKISHSLYHLMRGQIYELDGKRCFTFGGATSHDKAFRTEGKSWWKEELPSEQEMNEALDRLDSVNREVDYCITHCAPTFVQRALSAYFQPDVLTDFLEKISDTVSFKKWYFGHYHIDQTIGSRYRCLYQEIEEI